MSAPLIGFLISSILTLFLFVLFRIEDRRGVRYLPVFRASLDHVVVMSEQWWIRFFGFLHRDFLYQIVRYTYNGVLSLLLRGLRFFEHNVQDSIRRNRLMARQSDRVRTTRNKLDEIAEHKAAIALSEEEKKKRRSETLL